MYLNAFCDVRLSSPYLDILIFRCSIVKCPIRVFPDDKDPSLASCLLRYPSLYLWCMDQTTCSYRLYLHMPSTRSQVLRVVDDSLAVQKNRIDVVDLCS